MSDSIDPGVDPDKQRMMAMLLAGAQASQQQQQPGSGVTLPSPGLAALAPQREPQPFEDDAVDRSQGDGLRMLKSPEQQSHELGSTQSGDKWETEFKPAIEAKMRDLLAFKPHYRSAWEAATHQASPQDQMRNNAAQIEGYQKMLESHDIHGATMEMQGAHTEAYRGMAEQYRDRGLNALRTPKPPPQQTVIGPDGLPHLQSLLLDEDTNTWTPHDMGLAGAKPVAEKVNPLEAYQIATLQAKANRDNAAAERDRRDPVARAGKDPGDALELERMRALDKARNNNKWLPKDQQDAQIKDINDSYDAAIKKHAGRRGGAVAAPAPGADEEDDSVEPSDNPTTSAPPAGGASKAGGKPRQGVALVGGKSHPFTFTPSGKKK